MNRVNIFFKQFYHFHKADFWILIFCSAALGITFNFYQVNDLAEAGLIFILMLKCFSFLRSASIMPSISSDFDRFSWKYLQSLPFTRKELLFSLVLANLFVIFPLVVWLVSFLNQIAVFFTDAEQSLSLMAHLKVFLMAIPLICIISFKTIAHVIMFPRRQYSKNDPKHVFYSQIKKGLIFCTVAGYGLAGLGVVEEALGLDLSTFFKSAIKFTITYTSYWMILPAVVAMVYCAYSSTLRVWMNEKIGYVKVDWSYKRDVPIMSLCLMMLYFPFTSDELVPSKYQGSALHKSVEEKDYKKIENLLAAGADINQKNKFGFTPLLIAAHEGNFEMFMFLESKGAKYEGHLVNKGDLYHDGMDVLLTAIDGENIEIVRYLLNKGLSADGKSVTRNNYALHTAAGKCRTAIVDLLIENKADVNVVNDLGQSPLHLAAYSKCFGSVTSLLEAGADSNLKDKDGKTAFDYVSKKNKDLAYIFQKKTRAPAGK